MIALQDNCCKEDVPIDLSRREEEVLILVAYEYTTQNIALKLHLSPHTVISHRQRLMAKLGASNTAGMVRRGFEIGVLKVKMQVDLPSIDAEDTET